MRAKTGSGTMWDKWKRPRKQSKSMSPRRLTRSPWTRNHKIYFESYLYSVWWYTYRVKPSTTMLITWILQYCGLINATLPLGKAINRHTQPEPFILNPALSFRNLAAYIEGYYLRLEIRGSVVFENFSQMYYFSYITSNYRQTWPPS